MSKTFEALLLAQAWIEEARDKVPMRSENTLRAIKEALKEERTKRSEAWKAQR